MLKYLMEGFEDNRSGIWETELFGKPMYQLVKENLAQKLVRMPEETQRRTRHALSRVINDGKENMFCIVF